MRRWILPIALLVVVAVAAAGAVVVDSSADPEEPSANDMAAATPVLSARRLPELLLRPAGDASLTLALQPVVDGSPPDTCLVVADGSRVIVNQNADLPVVPASNLKILVGYAAVAGLGADTTYRTSIQAASAPVDGVIDGDLWVIGGGDPLIGTADFVGGFIGEQTATSAEALADAIVGAGVTTVTGNVIGDDSRYDAERRVPTWPDRGVSTGTPGPLGALLINRGFTSYNTEPGEIVAPRPSSDGTALAAQKIIDLLEERGVDVQGGNGSDVAPPDLAEVAFIESAPMSAVVAQMTTESDNTVAELLVKELGFQRRGEGSTAAGLEVVAEVLTEEGIDLTGVVLQDGSGLHDQNRVTCSAVMDVLQKAGPDSAFADGLPLAGETGTLWDRYNDTLVEGAMSAKTGTLQESTALSGYVDTIPGAEMIFAYIANAPDVAAGVVALQDPLAGALVLFPEGPAAATLAPKPAVAVLSPPAGE